MILSAALLLTLGAGEAMAQKRAFTIEDVYRSQYVGAPQLSPDGTRLVFTTTQQSLPAQSSKTNLVLMETGKNGTTRTLTTDGMSFGPQWSSMASRYTILATPRARHSSTVWIPPRARPPS